jgi:hypothetical protein
VPPAFRPAARVVQRYTTYWKIKDWGGLGRAMRVSDDGKMAVPDSQVFQGTKTLYLTADVVHAANQRLQAVAGSLSLSRTDDSIQGRKPWTMRTYQTLYRVSPRDTRDDVGGVGRLGGTGNTLRTLENCSAHGFDSLGLGVDAGAEAGSNREFRIDIGGGQTMRNQGSIMAPENDSIAKERIQEAIHRDKHRVVPHVAVTRAAAGATCQTLTTAQRRRYAHQFGMNEYAMPLVGDGIEALRAGGNFTGFPMHFAAVVARSGHEYFTLENFAKGADERAHGDTIGASNAWYFRMYGVLKTHTLWRDDDQSYGGQHAAEGSIADGANMMSLVNQNVAKPAVALAV